MAAFPFVNCQKCNSFLDRVIFRFLWNFYRVREKIDTTCFWTWHEIFCSFYIAIFWYQTQIKRIYIVDAQFIFQLGIDIWFLLGPEELHGSSFNNIIYDFITDLSHSTSLLPTLIHVRVLLCCSHISFNVPFNNKILRHKKVKVLLS